MGIQLEQRQKQVVSQKMIQSVNILQMSSLDLAEFVQEAALENPLIDFLEPEHSPEVSELHDKLKRLEWLDRMDEQNRFYFRYDQEEDAADRRFANIPAQEYGELESILWMQLVGKGYTMRQQKIFTYIIRCLDSKGYFTYSVSEAAILCHVTEDEVRECLKILQGLEPVGICSGSVQECLLRQLPEETCGLERTLVTDFLDMIGKNQMQAIARKLHVEFSEVVEAAAHIRKLNPFPAQGYGSGQSICYIVPDVMIVKNGEQFEIIMSDSACPTVQINKTYLKLLRSNSDKEVQDYLAQKLRQAEELREHISRRGSTLRSLAACILDTQKEFFRTGQNVLVPFRLAEAAKRIGCNKSTVSRAVKDKFLQCCWGIYPLSYFFPKGLATDSSMDNEPLPVSRIKQVLEELIKGEDKTKPYSDARLAECMSTLGIPISRRTVAKYREEMSIADCRGRKVFL